MCDINIDKARERAVPREQFIGPALPRNHRYYVGTLAHTPKWRNPRVAWAYEDVQGPYTVLMQENVMGPSSFDYRAYVEPGDEVRPFDGPGDPRNQAYEQQYRDGLVYDALRIMDDMREFARVHGL